MLKNLLKKREGFTLVEIIIVLAIVGLIFVIIFLAVAAAQRGQRDTARKDNVNRLIAVVQQYAGNNGGGYPTPGGSLNGYTLNAPDTSITQAAATKTTLDWRTAATGCASISQPSNGGTNGYVNALLDDGATNYCKDY